MKMVLLMTMSCNARDFHASQPANKRSPCLFWLRAIAQEHAHASQPAVPPESQKLIVFKSKHVATISKPQQERLAPVKIS